MKMIVGIGVFFAVLIVIATALVPVYIEVYLHNGGAPYFKRLLHIECPPGGVCRPGEDANFGFALAIYGNDLFIGANAVDTDKGVVLWYSREWKGHNNNSSVWVFRQIIKLSDGSNNDHFGRSVTANEDVLAVGAYGRDCSDGNYCGAVYLFKRNADSMDMYEQTQVLQAPDGGKASAVFGKAVNLDRTSSTLVVGENERHVTGCSGCGVAYVYVIDSEGTAKHVCNLAPTDRSTADIGANFGYSVAVSNATAVVGTAWPAKPGKAYVFEVTSAVQQPPQCKQVAVLVADEPTTGDHFGFSVAVDYNTILVGAKAQNNYVTAGAAYLYERNADGTWSTPAVKKFQSPNKHSYDRFGIAVAIMGDIAVVGGFDVKFPTHGTAGVGQVVVYYRYQGGDNKWGEVKVIFSPRAEEQLGTDFGWVLALYRNTVVIGAYGYRGHGGTQFGEVWTTATDYPL